jgi:hypothetical protein
MDPRVRTVAHVATPTRVLLRLMRPALPLAFFGTRATLPLAFFWEHAPPLATDAPHACSRLHGRACA